MEKAIYFSSVHHIERKQQKPLTPPIVPRLSWDPNYVLQGEDSEPLYCEDDEFLEI